MKTKNKVLYSTIIGFSVIFTCSIPLVIQTSIKKEGKKINNIGNTALFSRNISDNSKLEVSGNSKILNSLIRDKKVINWIRKVEGRGFSSFENDKKSLLDLHLSIEKESIMLRNLREKYWFKHITKKDIPNISTYSSATNPMRYTVDGEEIKQRGRNSKTVVDNLIDDDISYINWDNYSIMDKVAYTHSKDFKELKKEVTGLKKYIISDNKKITKASLSALTYILSAKMMKIQALSKSLVNKVGFFIGSKAGYNIINFGLNYSIDDFRQDWKSKINGYLTKGLKIGGEVIISGLLANPTTSIVGGILATADVLMNVIELGNGATIWENYNDHGLNDWRYQMEHNYKTMVAIAKSYSEDYNYGVSWKVTDGWLTLPKLYIKTSGFQGGWKNLSYGTSFNFGNKISLQEKPTSQWKSLDHVGAY